MNTPGKIKTNNRRSLTPYPNKRRTSSSGCFAPFKSPCSSERSKPTLKDQRDTTSTRETKSTDKVTLAQDVVQLQEKCNHLDKETNSLKEKYDVDELPQYIDKLHEYNEIKDIAQMIIGKIAEKRGTTTKSLYPNYNLKLED